MKKEPNFDALVERAIRRFIADPALSPTAVARLLAAEERVSVFETICAAEYAAGAARRRQERLRRPDKAPKRPRKAPFGRYGRILVLTSA
jgi:hypothetical protein